MSPLRYICICARSQPTGHLKFPSVTLLLLLSTLHQELPGGLAWAAITNGLGGVAAPATGGSSNPAFGSIQPVRAVEITNRKCELNALARVSDDRYCDKYFVCSSGKYVGLFCPLGMAFEYGLQECRLKLEVDCSKRPLFGGGLVQMSTSTPEPTTTPETTTMGITTSSPPIILPPPGEQTTTTMATPVVTDKIMTLPFGAKVIIPFGSTIILPPGSRIEMEPPPAQSGQLPHQHDVQEQQHVGHKHRRTTTSVDGIAAIVGSHQQDADPLSPPLTLLTNRKDGTIGDVSDDDQLRPASDAVESDQPPNDAEAADSADPDYYYEDEGVIEDGDDVFEDAVQSEEDAASTIDESIE